MRLAHPARDTGYGGVRRGGGAYRTGAAHDLAGERHTRRTKGGVAMRMTPLTRPTRTLALVAIRRCTSFALQTQYVILAVVIALLNLQHRIARYGRYQSQFTQRIER